MKFERLFGPKLISKVTCYEQELVDLTYRIVYQLEWYKWLKIDDPGILLPFHISVGGVAVSMVAFQAIDPGSTPG